MKQLIFIISIWAATSFLNDLQAQILTVSPGTDMTIKSGTVFSADNLILTPSADFTLSNLSLNKNSTVIHSLPKPYIGRVYQFTKTTNPFSGTVQINYRDAELKGINENDLALNIYNGTAWNAYTATSRNTASNFVLTSGLNNVRLNELTLINQLFTPAISSTADVKITDAIGLSAQAMPNPSQQYFTLAIRSNSQQSVTIKVTDVAGRLIEVKTNVAANSTTQLGNGYKPGAYFAQVLQGKNMVTLKLIKQAD